MPFDILWKLRRASLLLHFLAVGSHLSTNTGVGAFANNKLSSIRKATERRIMFNISIFVVLLMITAATTVARIVEWQEPLLLLHDNSNNTTSNERHAILVYIPGYDIAAEDYRPLVSLLQHELNFYNVSLHTSILRFPKFRGREFPPFLGRESLVEQALQQTREMTLLANKNVTVYLGGHSLGSILAQMVAYKNPSKFNGLIVHGGYVMPKYRRNREALPVPTLTLSGTRDGMNRFTYVAMQHNDLREMSSYYRHAASIVIEGMNHYHVANNAPPYIENQDFEEGISLQMALESVAKLTSVFMLEQKNITVENATVLEQEVKRSEERYFEPYIQAMLSDESGETCILAQQLHFENHSIEIESHQPHNRANFVFSKPRGNQTHVRVEMLGSKAFTWFGRSSVPQAIQTLRCKMVTKEQVFGKATMQYDSCASMNAHIFHRALDSLPKDMQQTYLEEGRRLEFREDIETNGGVQWLSADLEWTLQDDGTAFVRSPRLKTSVGNGRYSGKIYCVLLSMSRALEHIMLDSFPTKASRGT